ncbi:MAG: winged helix-turn-helix domain-containing protein [Bryobacteraceae bacterium]
MAITSREIEETLYCMRLESGEPFGWRIMGEGMEAQLNAERREIIALLAAGPLAPREIASALKKNPNTVRRLLQKLAQGGFVTKNGETYALSRAGE